MPDENIERRFVQSIWDINPDEAGRLISQDVTGPNQVTRRMLNPNDIAIDWVIEPATPTPEVEEHFWDQMEDAIEPVIIDPFEET